MLLLFIGYAITAISFVVIVILAINRKPFLRFVSGWLLLAIIIVFVPCYYSEVAGALSAFYLAGSNQVFTESRLLIQKCQQRSNKQSYCGYISEYPPAISRVYPEMVFVSDRFVVIGKVGLIKPDGFMIFLEGDEPSQSMRALKLVEELYWTYGN